MEEHDKRYFEIKLAGTVYDIDTPVVYNDGNFLKYLVIPIDSDWKSYFNFIILLCACQNVVIQAYYAAFGLPDSPFEVITDYVIEGFFALDLIFCFCQQYRD